jgi:hypothetical protein
MHCVADIPNHCAAHQELGFALAVLGRKIEVKHSKACAQGVWRKSIEAQP